MVEQKNNNSRLNLFKYLIFIGLVITIKIFSANNGVEKKQIYIDKDGKIRWTSNDTPAYFFGTNYTVPFAFSYRSHQKLNISPEKSIDNDVYHFARLGFNAFRVHVWDVEISDSVGNLIENEHLRLFDYLVMRLKERNIKILLTPIAYWGNGYPEKDEAFGGFSAIYGKGNANANEKAIIAQEQYIAQILKHKNLYTKLSYIDDPDVIALEINNEPSHKGTPEDVTKYIDRMIVASKNAGWEKPIFYNIAENSPYYSNAILNSISDGFTFQWYPTNLVHGYEIEGNFLPHVDQYSIPFATDPRFSNKAKIVYEFDAADIGKCYMYPAMARSFRNAGMQWATQFAYDPLALAFANAEYQTHYLNLAFTPSKAISLLIAGKVFCSDNLAKGHNNYPSDSIFGPFRVSYLQNLSEMNSEKEFYYSNNTFTKPLNIESLENIAGCGSSPIVSYEGTGAYFLDKLDDGIWRLEIFPDAFEASSPYAQPSLQKSVVEIYWNANPMKINIPNLSKRFTILGINTENTFSSENTMNGISVKPGVYLLTREGANSKKWKNGIKYKNINVPEYAAPKPSLISPIVLHKPSKSAIKDSALYVEAIVAGTDSSAKVIIVLSTNSWRREEIVMNKQGTYKYSASIPIHHSRNAYLNYYIVVRTPEKSITFPGNHTGEPTNWDYIYTAECYKSELVKNTAPIEIFNAREDVSKIDVSTYNWGKRNEIANKDISSLSGNSVLNIKVKDLSQMEHEFSVRSYFGNRLNEKSTVLNKYSNIRLRARNTSEKSVKLKLKIITVNGIAYSATVDLTNQFEDIKIPFQILKTDSMMLIPRPYPGFQPFWFKSKTSEEFDLKKAEVLEIAIMPERNIVKELDIEIESIKIVTE